MVKKFFMFFALAFAFTVAGHAQITILDVLKKNHSSRPISSSCIENVAIMPELSIIRQQYRMERNGEFFGKNNMPHYGETYSLAVKVSGGTYILGSVIEPWKDDADYLRVNADNKYKPVYYWTYQRALNDTVYKAVELELGTEYTKPVNADKSLWLHEETSLGLTEDKTAGKKQGTLVWAYAHTNVQDSAMQVELRQVSMQVNLENDSTLIPVELQDSDRVIGGLYVVPKYEFGGRVQFLLAGVAVKGNDSKWCLQMLAVPAGITPTNSSDNAGKKGKAVRKKGRKQDASAEPSPVK